ncbi:hypothetical protein [Geoalkalibacter subterraneus]|jgi:hypothetical protein|uniref:Uncharacterized protein n=1 Tax=Geoalkalibacter subterraneus TaxID=483547 RepID=A0A0B5FU75_9BACT|nr:hypothetical protein [Geoalkalibacter subterraneus]AJF07146.1 hypothetical protein GSUB_12020 [Geoalkalibacter subterraneus]
MRVGRLQVLAWLVALSVFAFVSPAWAVDPPFAGGTGESDAPYQIATAAQLDAVRSYLDKHFIVTIQLGIEKSS